MELLYLLSAKQERKNKIVLALVRFYCDMIPKSHEVFLSIY